MIRLEDFDEYVAAARGYAESEPEKLRAALYELQKLVHREDWAKKRRKHT